MSRAAFTSSPPSPSSTFALDLDEIRRRARSHLENGAVTDAYAGDRRDVLQMLNDSLATELVCVLRYRLHQFMSATVGGIPGLAVADEFLQHANEELAHADLLAERIVQLGGKPDFSPATLATRSHTVYVESDSLRGMLTEDLVAERIAIEAYLQIIRTIGADDPTTRRLLEQILAQEETHADELSDLLQGLPPDRA